MKKTVLVWTGASAVLAAVLRAVQYMFIIDGSGVFAAQGAVQTVLRYSVGGLLVICGVISLILCFIGKKGELVSERAAVGGRFHAVLFVLMSAATIYSCGFSIGKMLESSKFDVSVVFSALCAVYFALLAFELFAKRRFAKGVTGFFGLFAPVYYVACALIFFTGSINVATRSSTKLMLVAMSFAAVYAAFVSSTRIGAIYSVSRAKGFCSFACVSLAAGAAEIYPAISGDINIQALALPITFAFMSVAAFVSLVRLYSEPAREMPNPESEDVADSNVQSNPDGLDVYIDDIPDNEENN